MQNNLPEHIVGSRLVRFLLKIGSSSELDPEERRKRISAVFSLVILMIGGAVFSVYYFYRHYYSIVTFDVATFFISFIVLLFMRKQVKAMIAYWIIGFGCILFLCGTTILGRTEISLFLWAFLLPPIAFSILGDKRGLFIALAFLCTAIILMTVPDPVWNSTPYSFYIIVRFIIIYIALTFIMYYYESSQQMLIHCIQEERDKFERASKHDLLTGLSNRRDIIEKMETERERQLRTGKPFTIILGDIDNFKNLNDAFGHDAGDYVLQTIGGILRDQVRGIDCPSRWGGEEFLIMLVDTDLDGGQRVAERIRRKIENTRFDHKDTRLPVTMTLGLSIYRNEDENIDRCIKRADQALYEGKNQGKNQVVAV